jgi:hypothetical protein
MRLVGYGTVRVATVMLLCAGLGLTACGGDDDDDDVVAGSSGSNGMSGVGGLGGGGAGGIGSGATGGSAGSMAGSGGIGGSSGMGGSGGSSGRGGSAGMDDPDGGMATCVVPQPTDVASMLPKCSEAVCPAQDSVCVPVGTLEVMSSAETVAALPDCDATGATKCVPSLLVNYGGKFIAKTCRSLNDAEGRCLSSCIPQVAQQASQLPKDSCADSELCAPCFDPRTGEMTAACTQGCDPGPVEAPKPFPECCDGAGLCVSPALAGDQAASLEAGSCTGNGELCAPRELTDPTFKPKTCRSVNDNEGRCLSVCLGTVAKQIDQLPTAVCEDDERCAPCFDPRTGEDTGACKVNGDAPVEPPKTFTECCSMRGFCVDEAQAGEQAASLVADSCTGELLCAPKELTDPAFVPMGCDSIDGREGRCLSTCLGSVASQVDRLPTAGCMANQACAPCYDPITDVDTGACNVNGDMPAEHEAPFPRCCDNGQGTKVGVCVPPELAGDQADMLQQDTCAVDDLCAPLVKATNPAYKFPSCEVGGVAALACIGQPSCPGACVPSCIVPENQRGLLVKTATCGQGELCAPCSSGACD